MISEPNYGSDVAGIQTKADKKKDYYIVNGQKKWITGGLWSNWFTTAVRTGRPGMRGLSFLLINRNMPGLKIRKLKIQASELHNTTFVTLHNVKVPKKNLIGVEGMGFFYIVTNFTTNGGLLQLEQYENVEFVFNNQFITQNYVGLLVKD